MRKTSFALLVATAFVAGIAAEVPPPAQDDLTLRVIQADEASGLVEVTLSPAPHILLQASSGPLPAVGEKLPCEMLPEMRQLSCALPDGRMLDLFPRGFVLTARPPDLKVDQSATPLAATAAANGAKELSHGE